MAHLVEKMAYFSEVPWHGVGNQLSSNQSIEVWAQQAGMDWTIRDAPVCFLMRDTDGFGAIGSFPQNKVLFRSDTKAPLSVVSQRFQVVQPSELLEFYRDLTEVSGFQLETAGVLKTAGKFGRSPAQVNRQRSRAMT